MILGYLIWGDKDTYYAETAFSILTFLPDPAIDGICVLTDKPDALRMFKDNAKVRLVETPAREFSDWYGDSRFMFRAKIKGLERLVDLYPGKDMLYLDTDTFRGGDTAAIKAHLAKGGLCMHEFFGSMDVEQGLGKSRQKVWNKIKNRNWGGIEVGGDSGHWNAGCIGLPGGRSKELIGSVLRLNDAILAAWDGTPSNFTEEIAYCVALSAAGEVMDVAGIVGHYYKNKTPWQMAITEFLAMCRLKDNTLENDIEAAGHFDFQAIPIHSYVPRWRRRVNHLMERLLPDKRVRRFPERFEPH